MNLRTKKIVTIDRLILLGVLTFQLVILHKFLSHDKYNGLRKDDVSIQQPHESNDNTHHDDQLILMHLPLPPGFNDNQQTRSQLSPEQMFDSMHKNMSRMMQRAHNDFALINRLMEMDEEWDTMMKSPSMDMKDLDDNYIIVLSLPGSDISDIEVSLDGRLLIIKSHYEMQDTMGISHQQIEKRVLLPGPVNADGLTKTLSDDGILTVTIPKQHLRRTT